MSISIPPLLNRSYLLSTCMLREVHGQKCMVRSKSRAGALLKEAVEDLEWASGGTSVALLIKRNPVQITMSAQGIGELLIALPVRPPLLE